MTEESNVLGKNGNDDDFWRSIHCMRISYISYWSFDSGLTKATVIPALQYFIERGLAKHVRLYTAEAVGSDSVEISPGIHWQGIKTGDGPALFRGLLFLLHCYLAIRNTDPKPQIIWARNSMAGGAAYVIARWLKLPFVVESFEPHTQYMVEGGTWKKGSLAARIQRWLEEKQKTHATHLITVSPHYTKQLQHEGLDVERLSTIPCVVDFEQFRFDPESREEIRKRLGVSQSQQIGVYAGKFGDIYYDDRFFDLCERLIKSDPKFFLLFLTPMKAHAMLQLQKRGIPDKSYYVTLVDYEDVPAWLSSADLAFCPVRQSPGRLFCSPIKIGEYLANGLPVVSSQGIGEDSERIIDYGLGNVIDMEKTGEVIPKQITSLKRKPIDPVSIAYRDKKHAFGTYQTIFDSLRAQAEGML